MRASKEHSYHRYVAYGTSHLKTLIFDEQLCVLEERSSAFLKVCGSAATLKICPLKDSR